MRSLQNLQTELERMRDEIRLKVHLGTMDVRDEWTKLEARWGDFQRQAKLKDSATDVSEAVQILGLELKEAYERIRRAL